MSTAPAMPDSLELHLHQALYAPAAHLSAMPGKGLRSRLVGLGYRLAGGDAACAEGRRRCEIASSIIERIHLGSLIVDDIEDGSEVRRGGATVHRQFGLEKALNAANWLYFSPLLDLRQLELPAHLELSLHRDILGVLAQAHRGQALDVGVRIHEIPREEVPAVCSAATQWKTGELTGMALKFGAYVAEADPEVRGRLFSLGKSLGCGLQMLDDISNFSMDPESDMGPKRLEDFRLGRPSWIWSFLAQECTEEAYSAFRKAVALLPDEAELNRICQEIDLIPRARRGAARFLRHLASQYSREFQNSAWAEIGAFIAKLEQSYG
jgi:geranylgeranyl diphosphate synthase, type I